MLRDEMVGELGSSPPANTKTIPRCFAEPTRGPWLLISNNHLISRQIFQTHVVSPANGHHKQYNLLSFSLPAELKWDQGPFLTVYRWILYCICTYGSFTWHITLHTSTSNNITSGHMNLPTFKSIGGGSCCR